MYTNHFQPIKKLMKINSAVDCIILSLKFETTKKAIKDTHFCLILSPRDTFTFLKPIKTN